MSQGKNLRGLPRIVLALFVVVVIAVAGVLYVNLSPPNSSTTTPSSTQTNSSTRSNFTIALSPTAPLIAPGQTQNYSSIRISGTALNATIFLAVRAPPGLTFLLNTTSVSLLNNPQTIPLVLKAAAGLSAGKYPVTIVASAARLEESHSFNVEVVPALVVLQALAFHPQNITVPKGTNVTWINLDSNIGCCDPGTHTVVFLSGASASSPQLKLFDAWSYQFNASGEVKYFCSIHPYMKGDVTVTG